MIMIVDSGHQNNHCNTRTSTSQWCTQDFFSGGFYTRNLFFFFWGGGEVTPGIFSGGFTPGICFLGGVLNQEFGFLGGFTPGIFFSVGFIPGIFRGGGVQQM
jgi:hypothetical protein